MPASTWISSTLKPTASRLSLTTAWVFWRTGLIDGGVLDAQLHAILLADIAIQHPAGLLQHLLRPARDRTRTSCSGTRSRQCRRGCWRRPARHRHPRRRSWRSSRGRRPGRRRLAHGLVGEERVRGVHLGALAVDFGVRVGEVEVDALDVGAEGHQEVPWAVVASISARISGSTCRFQAKSQSPVWITARAAEAASPPPLSVDLARRTACSARGSSR